MSISPDCGLLWVYVVMLGLPSMKNSKLSHANTALLVPINPCNLRSFLVTGPECTHTAVRLEEDSDSHFLTSDQSIGTCLCLDGIFLTCPKLAK